MTSHGLKLINMKKTTVFNYLIKIAYIISNMISLIYFSLILPISLCDVLGIQRRVLGVDQPNGWKEIHPQSLKCPSFSNFTSEFKDLQTWPVKLSHPHIHDNATAEGYICHKLSMQTECTMTWWLSKTVIQRILPKKTNIDECKFQLKRYLSGDKDLEYFPPASCVYNSVDISDHILFQFTRHDVIIDPYNGLYLDEIFINGNTRDDFSQTIFDSSFWLVDERKPHNACDTVSFTEGLIYMDHDWKDESYLTDKGILWTHQTKPKKIKDSCRLALCGMRGLRFPDGEWYEVNFMSPEHKGLFAKLENLPICVPGKMSLSLSVLPSEDDYRKEEFIGYMFRQRCLDTIAKIRNREHISPYEISYLTQTHPGIGPGFVVMNGTLMSRYIRYKLVDTSKSNITSNVVGHDSTGTPVLIRDLQSEDNKSISLNGIVKGETNWVFPQSAELDGEIDDEMTRRHLIREYRPPVIHIISNHTNMTSQILFHHPDSINVISVAKNWLGAAGEAVSEMFSGFWNWFKWILYIFLGILIVIVLKYIFKFCAWLRTPTKQEQDDHDRPNLKRTYRWDQENNNDVPPPRKQPKTNSTNQKQTKGINNHVLFKKDGSTVTIF